MYICYLDESGTAELSGNSTQFVYAGLAIPAMTWRDKDIQIQEIKSRHFLPNTEIHTAWMVRPYPEQDGIVNFSNMTHDERKQQVLQARTNNLSSRIARGDSDTQLINIKKNYKKTLPYIHLTLNERRNALIDIARCIESWSDTRVFFHAIDKNACDTRRLPESGLYETAFQELMSRFQYFLTNKGTHDRCTYGGIIVTDNNQSIEKKLTSLSRTLHLRGTRWVQIPNIVETPLFVNSETTSMVQLADLIAYTIRRHIENGETYLFDHIFPRVDKAGSAIVGGRHYTWNQPCSCSICQAVRGPHSGE